jgi:hypothetical protein
MLTGANAGLSFFREKGITFQEIGKFQNLDY